MVFLGHDQPAAMEPVAVDPEALIEEARQRARRRRRRRGVLVALLVGGVLVAGWIARTGGRPAVISETSSRPFVNVRAFTHEGGLAFVSRGVLWVLDAAGVLRKLPTARRLVATAPAFSADGRWLAYLAFSGRPGDRRLANAGSALWIARADGSDAHELAWLRDPELIGWSPRGDRLAVTEQGSERTAYGYTIDRQTSAWLIGPGGSRRRIAAGAEIDGGAWSPDGSKLALAIDTSLVQTTAPWSAFLAVYPVNGGRPSVWLRLESAAKVGRWNANLILPAGWWSGWGIGFWLDTASGNDPSVRYGGGLQLWYVAAPGRAPRRLGSTLSNRTVSPISSALGGQLAITDEPGNSGAEPIWQNQRVARCDATSHRCVAVAQSRGTVSLDPSWSPDGSSLVYLVGRNLDSVLRAPGEASGEQSVVEHWYDTLELSLYAPRSGSTRRLRLARGAVVPIWSRSGDQLMYVADDGLWLLRRPDGHPTEIAAPLLPPRAWNAIYAQLDWSDQFAWSSP